MRLVGTLAHVGVVDVEPLKVGADHVSAVNGLLLPHLFQFRRHDFHVTQAAVADVAHGHVVPLLRVFRQRARAQQLNVVRMRADCLHSHVLCSFW